MTDEKKVPLPGVSVRWEGTTVGTATDAEGRFKVLMPADSATLVVFLYRDEDREVKILKLKAGEVRTEGVDIVLRMRM